MSPRAPAEITATNQHTPAPERGSTSRRGRPRPDGTAGPGLRVFLNGSGLLAGDLSASGQSGQHRAAGLRGPSSCGGGGVGQRSPSFLTRSSAHSQVRPLLSPALRPAFPQVLPGAAFPRPGTQEGPRFLLHFTESKTCEVQGCLTPLEFLAEERGLDHPRRFPSASGVLCGAQLRHRRFWAPPRFCSQVPTELHADLGPGEGGASGRRMPLQGRARRRTGLVLRLPGMRGSALALGDPAGLGDSCPNHGGREPHEAGCFCPPCDTSVPVYPGGAPPTQAGWAQRDGTSPRGRPLPGPDKQVDAARRGTSRLVQRDRQGGSGMPCGPAALCPAAHMLTPGSPRADTHTHTHSHARLRCFCPSPGAPMRP